MSQAAETELQEAETGPARTHVATDSKGMIAPAIHGEDTARVFPILFQPHTEMQAGELHEMAQQNARENFTIRLKRSMFIILLPVIFLFVLGNLNDRPLSKVVGSTLLIEYAIYFSFIFRLFCSGARNGRGLYRIYSASATPSNWAKMSVSSHQLLYKNRAIQSISEFSAIDGGVPNTMLATLSAFTWCTLVMFLATFSAWTCNFKYDASDYCQLVGVAGLVLIGMFELDPFNKWMKRFHYIGAAMGTGTIIGYFIQQLSLGTKIWLPILISVIALSAFIAWQVFNKLTDKFEQEHENITLEDVEKIQGELSRFTMKNVLSEAIFLFCGALCTCLWIIEYDQNCSAGCKGPQTDVCDNCTTQWDEFCVGDNPFWG